MAMQSIGPIERIGAVNGASRAAAQEKAIPAEPVGDTGIAHILVAIRMETRERAAVAQALRMATAHRARVTLLHVLAPVAQPSHHWLDAIDTIHRRLAGEARDTATAIQRGRAEIADFLERLIPRELCGTLDIRVECRVGDVVTEIARFADEQAIDLVVLGSSPSRWRPALWPGVSQRVLRLLNKPTLFVQLQGSRHGNGAAR